MTPWHRHGIRSALNVKHAAVRCQQSDMRGHSAAGVSAHQRHVKLAGLLRINPIARSRARLHVPRDLRQIERRCFAVGREKDSQLAAINETNEAPAIAAVLAAPAVKERDSDVSSGPIHF